MKYCKPLVLVFIGILGFFGCTEQRNPTIDLSINPGELELFAEGIISTALYERDIAISPDGNEIIYTLGDCKQNKRYLVTIRKSAGGWSQPEILNISGEYQDIEPFFANDGNRLFFASTRPVSENNNRQDYNIWYSDRKQGSWSEPVALGEIINSEGDEYYPSVSENGNLYFTASRENGIGREDIFRAKFSNGEYEPPECLDTLINTAFFEFNAYVSPDETILIFSSYGRQDGLGGGDLYISIKDMHGKWTKAKNMGKQINSNNLDYCPFIDWTGNNFYFTSERMKNIEAKWTQVDELINYANNSQNGFGDIYRISLDKIGIKQ